MFLFWLIPHPGLAGVMFYVKLYVFNREFTVKDFSSLGCYGVVTFDFFSELVVLKRGELVQAPLWGRIGAGGDV